MLDNGRVVDYNVHLDSLFSVKYVRSLVNLAYFLEKGYPVSPSSLASFSEIFLPLNLYWFDPLEAFFEFFYFSAFKLSTVSKPA